MSNANTLIFRVVALRYGADGYPAAVRWRILTVDAVTPDVGPIDIATADEALVAAYANTLFLWGASGKVNRIQLAHRPDGGMMLVDAVDTPPGSRLRDLPTF